MSKGRRSQSPQHAAPDKATVTEHAADLEMGNAAFAEELDGNYIPMDAAGDGAKPIVEHARLALEARYEGETPLARLIALVEASDLPEESAAWLGDRLKNTQATEALVADALKAWFGQSDDATRARVEQALAAVAHLLDSGVATEEGWRVDGQVVAVSRGASVRSAVDGLIQGLAPEQGAAIVGLCRQLHLAVMLDDEDDEVELDWGLGL